MAPFGITELFSEILVVHRTALGVPQEPFGSLRGSFGSAGPTEVLQIWPSHRLARCWNLGNEAFGTSELGENQSKKGCGINTQMLTQHGKFDAYTGLAIQFKHFIIGTGTNLVHSRGNQQTTKDDMDDGDVFAVIDIVDLLDTLMDDSNVSNDLPNNYDNLPSCDFAVLEMTDLLDSLKHDSNHDFQTNNLSLGIAPCLIETSELMTRLTIDNGFWRPAWPWTEQSFANGICVNLCLTSTRVRTVLPLCVVNCLVCVHAASLAQLATDRRAYLVGVDAYLPVSFSASALSYLALALPSRLRCPSRVCSPGAFSVCL